MGKSSRELPLQAFCQFPPSALTRGDRAHSSQARVGHALSQISTGAGPFDHVDGKWRAMLPS